MGEKHNTVFTKKKIVVHRVALSKGPIFFVSLNVALNAKIGKTHKRP